MCVLLGFSGFLFLCNLNGKGSFLLFESLIKSCQIHKKMATFGAFGRKSCYI